jgi:hypothetical protein
MNRNTQQKSTEDSKESEKGAQMHTRETGEEEGGGQVSLSTQSLSVLRDIMNATTSSPTARIQAAEAIQRLIKNDPDKSQTGPGAMPRDVLLTEITRTRDALKRRGIVF